MLIQQDMSCLELKEHEVLLVGLKMNFKKIVEDKLYKSQSHSRSTAKVV